MICKEDFVELMEACRDTSAAINKLELLLDAVSNDGPLVKFFYKSTEIFHFLLEVGDEDEAFYNSCWAIIDNYKVLLELEGNKNILIETPEEFYDFWINRTCNFPISYKTIT